MTERKLAAFLRSSGVDGVRGEPVEVALETFTSPTMQGLTREMASRAQAQAVLDNLQMAAQAKSERPSGFFGRLGSAGESALRFVGTPFLVASDLGGDLGRGDGFTLGASLRRRTGDALGAAFGPDGVIGSGINLIPEPARDVVNAGLKPLFWVSDLAYRNVVDRPLATLSAAGQIATDEGGALGGLGNFFEADTWRRARTFVVENDLSAGQSFAIMLGAEELPETEEEISSLLDRNDLWIASTSLDLAANFILDPLDRAGTGARLARARRYGINDVADINKVMDRASTSRMLDNVADMSAADIRSRYFPNNVAGVHISTMLEAAPDRSMREVVLRVALGDEAAKGRLLDDALLKNMAETAFDTQAAETALVRLADGGDELAQALTVARERQISLADSILEIYDEAPPSTRGVPGSFEDVLSQADEAAAAVEAGVREGVLERRALRAEASFATIQDTRTFGAGPTALRHQMTASRFYQRNPLASPLRYVVEKTPQRVLNLNDTTGVEQVRRLTLRSKVDADTAADLQARYAAALTPEERFLVAEEALNTSIDSVLTRAGLNRAQVEEGIKAAADERKRARFELGGSIIYDADGRAKVMREIDGEFHSVELPFLESQTPNLLPIGNFYEFEKAAKAVGRFTTRFPGMDVPLALMENLNRAWKMSALMRLGWPLRVLSDERLRMLARFQTLGDTTGQNRVSAWRINRRLGGGDYRVQAPSGRIYDLPEGLDATQAGLVSADGLARRFYRGQEDAAYTALSSDSMKWTRMEASDVSAIEYDGSWERAVNEQIGKSAPARMVLEGRSDPEIVDWLRNSAEGRQVVSRMARMDTQSIPEWVALIRDQVDAYIPTPELKAAALDGAASAAALRAAKADGVIDALPAIHGGVLENMIGGDVMRAWNKAYDKVVTSLGSKPTNRLSRNPTFRQFYEAETIRQIELLDNQGVMLDAADIDRIVGNSRRYALRETRQLLYDLSETSQLGESLRFVSPFYNAFEEVATRWIGLAYDNPAVLGKMGIAFRLLEDQTVEDENGNRFIELRVPEALAKHLPFARVTPTIRIAPERLPGATDLLYNQGPGVGPWVSIPVNEVLKERPELEESVRFMLPFGASGGAVTDFVLPPTARNIWTLRNAYFDPENDERFQATVMRIFRDRVTDWQLNDDDPDWDPVLNEVYSSLWEDSLRDAREFWAMRSISSAVSPVQGQWLSPYQTFMDTFREGSNLYLESPELFKAQYGYDEPDDWFIAEYGPAYWALTESIRRNPEGLAPTIEAREVRDKYGDLLTRFPEFGAAIAGAEDEGEFNRAVYDVDFELRDKDEFMKAPEVGLGWHEYIATRDLIDEALERRQRAGGSLSLNARANQDLRAINTAKLEELFERYPAWQREFEQTDRGKQRVTNEAFREIMTDERLRTRPDWQGVAGYFDDRDAIVAVLRQREAVGLPSSLASHTDLSVLWEAMVTQRRIDNPEFAALWARWLENDALTASDPVGGM